MRFYDGRKGHSEGVGRTRSAGRSSTAEQHYSPLVEDTEHEETKAGSVPDEDLPKVAASKAISVLKKMEHDGFCSIEADSVYGAAVAMPQIARSCGWPGSLISVVIRVYFFTMLNFLMQGFLLSMIGEEQLMMYPFAGQMHLCDFGASIKECPDAPNCKGPMGTTYSMPRLYSFPIWSTRVFVKDSLKAIFPDLAEEIDAKVDPGEYGLESYHCRLACVFLFMLAVAEDLKESIGLARTLWRLPSRSDPWISYSWPTWASKEEVKKIKEINELDCVKFHVAGIPTAWKVFYYFFVVLPKFGLWLAVAKSGVHYLMETAGIVDMIVNAMALTFVLEVDEMVFHRFTTSLTKHIMNNIQDLPNFDTNMEDSETDQQALERFKAEEFGTKGWGKLLMCIPWRLIFVLVLQALFVCDYYHENCQHLEDGSWVSKELRLPKVLAYRPIELMFGLLSTDGDPVWKMPSD